MRESAEWTSGGTEGFSSLREELENVPGGWSTARILEEQRVQCGWSSLSKGGSQRESQRGRGGICKRGQQNIPPQNIPLWHKEYFEKQQTQRSSENSYPFTRDYHVYKGNLHFQGCLFLCTRKGRLSLNHKRLILMKKAPLKTAQ